MIHLYKLEKALPSVLNFEQDNVWKFTAQSLVVVDAKVTLNVLLFGVRKEKSCTLLQENIQFHTVQTDSISSVSWHPANKERVSLKPDNLECWNMMQWVSPILPVTIMKFKTKVSKNWCKKAAVPLPPKHLTRHMHVVRFIFCIIGQMWQVTATVLER